MQKFLVTLAVVCGISPLLSANTISDGTFAGWALSSFGNGSMTLEAANGNPGARLNATTTTGLDLTFVYDNAIDSNVTITGALSGSFSLSLDVLSGANDFGAGQAIGLLVQQGGDIYLQFLANTGFPQNTFTTLNFNGTFVAASFSHLVGTGVAAPDFSGGTSSLFGFSAYNRTANRTLTKYYDNFNLTYTSAAVPEPSTWLLFGCAAGGLFLFRKLSAAN